MIEDTGSVNCLEAKVFVVEVSYKERLCRKSIRLYVDILQCVQSQYSFFKAAIRALRELKRVSRAFGSQELTCESKCTYRSRNAAKKARLADVRVPTDQQGARIRVDGW